MMQLHIKIYVVVCHACISLRPNKLRQLKM